MTGSAWTSKNPASAFRSAVFDETEVRKALASIIERGKVFEVRAIEAQLDGRYPGTAFGYFDTASACIDALQELQRAVGVYVTINPVNPALLARAQNRLKYARKGDATTIDHDIERRYRLLIDVDPIRPSGISATDAEKAAAHKKAGEIYDYLESRGWHLPVLADSGNGFHLSYRIDLPREDDRLCEKVLTSLAGRFDGEGAKVDRSVHNPARIARLYGTLAAKGDNTADRPHRPSKILVRPLPTMQKTVTREQLQALVEDLQPAKSEQARNPTAKRGVLRKPNKAEIREMLAVIPRRPEYPDWIKIVSA